MLPRSPGAWLQVIGVAHAGVGLVLHREALFDIARNRVVATVPDSGDRATAFWFLTVAPLAGSAGDYSSRLRQRTTCPPSGPPA